MLRRICLYLALAVAVTTVLVLPGLTREWRHAASAQTSEASSSAATAAADTTGETGAATAQDAPARRTAGEMQKFDELVGKAREHGSVRVIVGLNTSFTPEGYLSDERRAAQRADISMRQGSLLKQLRNFRAEDVVQFRSIRYMGLTADAETVEFLRRSPEVRSIREDEFRDFSLFQSTDMIGAPFAWGRGHSGLGQVIAILDSGVDKNHPFLSGKVIKEACFSVNQGTNVESLCPGGAIESMAPGSGLPCQVNEECHHGTKVAGIAAGRSSFPNRQGVARDASLVSIQISVKVTDEGICNGPNPCVRTKDINWLRALDYVLSLRYDGMNIAAANLSLGKGIKSFAESCDSVYPDVAELVSNLRAVDVATIAATGNEGETQKMNAPACISSVISVGSVGDGSFGGKNNTFAFRDAVSPESNNAPFLDLLAPGEWVETSIPGGGFASDGGTSMAAPHVAGAWAVLRQQVPGARVQHVLDVLRSTGKPVTDFRNGVNNTKPRIQLDQAVLAMQACRVSLSAEGALSPSGAASGAFSVFVPAGCAWTAVSNDPWITTSSGGNGSGVVSFNVAANAGAARVGSVSIADLTFTVFQSPTGAPLPGTLKASGVALSGFLGYSVAVSGDTAVVSAHGEDIGLNLDQGAAYVFFRSGTTWALQQKLTAPDGAASDQFGWSVAVSGNTAVVGAPGDDINANADQGSAYVFVRSGSAWALQRKLTQADGAAVDNFGWSVAVDGNTAVVGAFRDDEGFQQNNGSAHVFFRSGTTWTPQGKLLAVDRATDSQFGYSVGVSGDSVIVGARFDGFGVLSPDRGAAYVFVRGGTAWSQQGKLVAADRGAGDHFGYSVAIRGNTAVVGSRFDDVGLNRDQGSAYVYTRVDTTWRQRAKLTASDGAAGDEFGISVALADNFIVVGAIQDAGRNGKAYYFGRSGLAWVQQPTLYAVDGAPGDAFGASVAVDGNTAVVGAVFDDALRGSAYIFSPLTLSGVSTVQFAAAAQSVSEATRKVLVTVTRTGSLASAASVDFATKDGVADRRRDYTQTLGTLRFAPGESSKTVTVFITDDVVPEPAETFSVELLEPVGTALGATPRVTVTINSNDTVLGGNPVDGASFNADFFVRQHYVDFLNREADVAGLAFWVGNFPECAGNQQCLTVKRVNVSAAFFLSIEFQETGYFVYRMYKAAYGDTSSPGVAGTVPVVRLEDFLPDTQAIGQGVQVNVGNWQLQLDNNKMAYAFDFVQRQRFLDALPMTLTPAQFVDQLNQNCGGVLSPAERIQLITELSLNNTVPGRVSVLRRVADDPDLRVNEFRRAFVLMQYYGYLRRNPDEEPEPARNFAGWKFWLDKLNQNNGNYVTAEMVRAFITSAEYKNRFVQ